MSTVSTVSTVTTVMLLVMIVVVFSVLVQPLLEIGFKSKFAIVEFDIILESSFTSMSSASTYLSS
jgi:hypothetical protein